MNYVSVLEISKGGLIMKQTFHHEHLTINHLVDYSEKQTAFVKNTPGMALHFVPWSLLWRSLQGSFSF